MIIKNHILQGAKFVATPNVGGFIDPSFVVMHYTAGWSGSSAINTLCNPASKASAHVVVDRDGTITQLAPFNRKTWHAGPSRWMGIEGMNSHAIGIEIVNPGWLVEKGGKIYFSDLKSILKADRLAEYDVANAVREGDKRVGPGTYIWPAYTPAQIEAVKQIFAAICAAYKIKDVTGHEDVDTRGWKVDPGPAFPMPIFKNMLHAGSVRADPTDKPLAEKRVNTAVLNVRAKPSILSSKVSTLKSGQKVLVIATTGDWSQIQLPNLVSGYVASKFLV